MDVSELFTRCVELTAREPSGDAVRYMHQTLVLACAEALKGSGQGFGNVFSQVDYLCKRNGISMRDRQRIQLMRRHSNGRDTLTHDDWLYDIRALSYFISTVFAVDIPHDLLTRIPANPRPQEHLPEVNLRYIRCVVNSWDDGHIYATTDNGPVTINTSDPSLASLLTIGMQLNLLDCHADGTSILPGLVVVEPDYLVDISAIAACFQDYGHHPFSYLLSRLSPRANSPQILLGNFASAALDDLIHHIEYQPNDTIRQTFRKQALQFCTCDTFDPQQFKADAATQVANIREAVNILFGDNTEPGVRQPESYDRTKALLEPSFVCERLGLQGRVDLMTTDMRLLVEQKSGKKWNTYKEDHYVQLLLYYGVLRYNFQLPADRIDIRLLYSKYPAEQGLLVINFYKELFQEAIHLRNRIVAQEISIARNGFKTIMPQLRASVLLENKQRADFFERYIRPRIDSIFLPLQKLSDVERDYVDRMLSFVYREQLAQKVGVQEGQGGAVADLWNMPLADKQEAGNILLGTIVYKENETITLAIDTQAVLPNFRRGDMVYLYHFEKEPDVCSNILFKGVIKELTDCRVTVRLNDSQQNPTIFSDGTYAIEHGSSDIGATSALRSIHTFCTAAADKRQLLLGLRPPRRDITQQLSHSYHPYYDDVLLHAKQARDYFLLQGPPGTGKTSMALRFLVEEELRYNDIALSCDNDKTIKRDNDKTIKRDNGRTTECRNLLLTAYTNRAVDEICGMLEDAGFNYIRLGNEASCDPRFVPRLLEIVLGQNPKLNLVRQQLLDIPIIVSTTSTLLARPHILELKHFSLCIVDEASQILEPNIIGLLVANQIERFILIGDHKQLPAVVQQPDDEPRLHTCRLSLFERLLEQERKAGRTDFIGLLNRQGRMHPDIAAFPNEMFYTREQLQPVPCPHQTELQLNYLQPSEDALDEALKQHRVLFLPVTMQASESKQQALLSDKANPEEAKLVADLLRRIERQTTDHFDPDRTVGVIVPYRNQIAMIRHEIAQLGIPRLMDISIDTVERYQGSQRDVIIYSFTIRHPYQLDFLTANCFEESDEVHHSVSHTIDRKLNVAMTRARQQLLMTGNPAILSRNPLFAELIHRYQIK